MTRLRLFAAAVCTATLAVPSFAQISPAQSLLDQDAAMLALRVGEASVQSLELPATAGKAFIVDVSLAGSDHELILSPHEVRGSGYQLLVQGADGAIDLYQPGASTTYRGFVAGHEDSVVAGSLFEGQLTALVSLGDEVFGVQPVSGVVPGAAPERHVVYAESDVQPHDGRCVALPNPLAEPEPPVSGGGGFGDGGPAPLKVVELACDADVQFYQDNGSSVAATEADITNVINAMGAIYLDDTGVIYDITTILVRTSEPDPYTSSSAFTLLDQFVAEWTNNQAAIPRDHAQLFTGRNIDGGIIGIAYLDVICNFDFGYGLVESNFTSDFATRVGLSAHECGHNWGAGHCDGQADCWIMCSFIAGCGGDVTQFGSSSINAIVSTKNSSPCLEDPVGPGCGLESYGEGLNPTTLTGTGSGAIGTAATFTYSDPSAAPSNAFIVVAGMEGNQPFAGGTLLFVPSSIIFFTAGVSFGSTGDTPSEVINIPNNPGLAGSVVVFQAVHFNGAWGGPGTITEMSNGVELTICP